MDRRYVCRDCSMKWFVGDPERPGITHCEACGGPLVRLPGRAPAWRSRSDWLAVLDADPVPRTGEAGVPNGSAAPDPTVRIVLADDHALARESIEIALVREPGYRVVDGVGDMRAAIRAAAIHRPDIVVIDVTMPGCPGLEVIPQILRRSRATRIIVLTRAHDASFAELALRTGAHGCVFKEAAGAELVAAVRAALGNATYVSSHLSGPPTAA